MEFDDQDAIDFILANLPADIAARHNEDSVQYFIDTLFDFYEDNGLLDIDFDDNSDEEAEQAMVLSGLQKILCRDKHYHFEAPDVEAMLRAETAYEESIL